MNVFKGENKKLLQNPSFYFVILIIIASIFILGLYANPNKPINYLDFENKSYDEVMRDFNSEIKSRSDNYLSNASELINSYKNRTDVFEIMQNHITKTVNLLAIYEDDFSDVNRENLSIAFNSFINDFLFYTESNAPYYYLIYNDRYLDYGTYLAKLNYDIKDLEKVSNEELHSFIVNKNYRVTLTNFLDNLYNFTVSDEFINDVNSKITVVNEYLTAKHSEILENYNTTRDLDDLKLLINQYYLQAYAMRSYTTQGILLEALSPYSDMQIRRFFNLKNDKLSSEDENINLYEVKEIVYRNKYLIENNISYADVSFVSGITNRTSYNYSIFDFAYVTTEVSFIIILIYLIFLCSYTIAGERSRGTLKLMLIRPYKRYKILLSKILSAMVFGFFLLLMSYAMSLLIGSIFIKTTADLSVLVVFSASKVFLTKQTTIFFIYLLCKFIELVVWLLFFIMISVLLPKEIFAILISSSVVGITLLLKGLVTKISILSFLPNLNISLYKYWGGASNLTNTSLRILTQPPVLTISCLVSVIYIIVMIATFCTISFKKFKTLDIL